MYFPLSLLGPSDPRNIVLWRNALKSLMNKLTCTDKFANQILHAFTW